MIIHRIRDRLVWEPSARAVVSPPPSLSDQSVLEQHWPRGSAFVGRDSAYQHDIDYVGVSIERPMFPFFIFPIFLSFSFFFLQIYTFSTNIYFSYFFIILITITFIIAFTIITISIVLTVIIIGGIR